MPVPSATFNPTPDRASRVLADLGDTSLSFDDLARKHSTTSESLALWLSTSNIKDRIHLSLDAMALRTRAIAASRLPAALRAITELIESNPVLCARATGSGGTGSPDSAGAPDSLSEREFRRRHNESIRRACTILLRLANFFSPTRPPAPRTIEDSPQRPSRAPSTSAPRSPTTNGAHHSVAARPEPAAQALAEVLHREPTNGAVAPHAAEPSRQPSPGRLNAPSLPAAHWLPPHAAVNRERSSTQDDPSVAPECSVSLLTDPRPPPSGAPGAYQRPRQRFKVRR